MGATIVHLHVRDPQTGRPSMKFEYYKEVFDLIKQQNSEVIINLTTGPGALFIPSEENPNVGHEASKMFRAPERVFHIEKLRPDICTIDLNTMNLPGPGVRINHINVCKKMLSIVQEAGVKPELEIFDTGDLVLANELIAAGVIAKDPLMQFVLGTKYGWPADPQLLQYAASRIDEKVTWSAFGIGRHQMPMISLVWMLGGHIRVGLEDNIYLSKSELAQSNAQLVEKAKRIVVDIGGEVANYNETRELFKLTK